MHQAMASSRWPAAVSMSRATNAFGKNVDTQYDINSNVAVVTQPGNKVMTYSYDQNNRNNLETTEMPTGATSTADYGTNGTVTDYQPSRTEDAQQNGTEFSYDAGGNLTGTTNDLATENQSSVTYETSNNGPVCGAQKGQVCKTTDARGKVTSFEYDAVGNLTRVVPPAPLGDTVITHDPVSRVATVSDGRNQVRSFTYDDLDRTTRVTFQGGVTFDYTYDANGNVTERTEGSGTWTMAYDDANRLLSQDGPEDFSFTYDGVGNATSVTNLNGTTEYEYTAINMLELLRDPQGAETSYTYDAEKRDWRIGAAYPNGVTAEMQYDTSGRMIRTTSRDANNQLINDDQYTFTDPGNPNPGEDSSLRRTWEAKDGRTETYSYDALNRLTASQNSLGGTNVAPLFTYTYDGNSNRTSSTLNNGTPTTYTYNNADQIGGANHDANGNMTSSTAWGLAAGTYNTVDQTTNLTPRNQSTLPQGYAGTTQTHWLTSGTTSFETTASLGITRTDNGTISEYTRDSTGALVSMRRNGETYYYVFDGRGSVVSLTDEDGLQVNAYRYEPYGKAAYTLENVPQPFRWNSGYTLNGTLYKFGARYYDTTIGRWTQVDAVPSEPRYAYAGSDPINNSDSSGYAPWDDLSELPVVGRYARAAEDAFDDDSEPGDGLNGLLAYTAGNLLGTSTCVVAVIGLTGGIGTPASVGCFLAGSAVGSFAESQYTD